MVQNVVLNLKSPQAIKTDIAFTQGDYGEAKLSIMVKDNDVYVSGDEGANIAFLRADSNIVTGNLIGANGLYTYTFEGNELECAGNVVATVTINYPNGRVSAAAFCFNVRYNPAYDKKIPAGPYIVELEKIKEQAQSYVDYLQELIGMLQPDIGSTALTKADLINGFDQTAAGLKALDAAAGKTLKSLIDGKIATSQIVNNLLATAPGNVLDATQGKALKDSIDQLNSDIAAQYWSGVGNITPATQSTWINSEKSITFPPGTYIIGYKADTTCANSIYIDTSIDTINTPVSLYEKTLIVPVSGLPEETTNRSVNNVMMRSFGQQTTLHFFVWCSRIGLTLQYELWAIKIK